MGVAVIRADDAVMAISAQGAAGAQGLGAGGERGVLVVGGPVVVDGSGEGIVEGDVADLRRGASRTRSRGGERGFRGETLRRRGRTDRVGSRRRT